ncbi:MAG: bifunctional DNA-formamidopyrimidine glycosylase/DNA-(apurinic or apyrimidinic site) lyase [Proteobacteria bacterium]|nr:bifunctional DNA-formamidopyrimidine glycosylase/DNA-(apurinic or apyrimidinic site) lyase [Pseudomonadota bacterium]
MPELPEVETICRAMAPVLEGRRVAGVFTGRYGLRTPFPCGLARKLAGRRILACRRRAKYILLELDDGAQLALHLGMSGRILIVAGPHYKRQKHDHLVLTLEGGDRIVLNDPRRFGMVFFVTDGGDSGPSRALTKMGPEPLESEFHAEGLLRSLAGRKTAVKNVLLDQKIVAGLGNIYVCEALFYAGIDPRRAAGSLTADEAKQLVKSIRKVLRAALKAGGSTLRDYRKADGGSGLFQHEFSVYGRAGARCPGCDCAIKKTGGIRKIPQGGRSTFYCPVRQE